MPTKYFAFDFTRPIPAANQAATEEDFAGMVAVSREVIAEISTEGKREVYKHFGTIDEDGFHPSEKDTTPPKPAFWFVVTLATPGRMPHADKHTTYLKAITHAESVARRYPDVPVFVVPAHTTVRSAVEVTTYPTTP